MPSRNVLRLHAGLMDDMANMLDVDLEDAAIQGKVSIDEISDAVLRCTDCPNPAHCETLLSETSAMQRAPEYCRNQELLHKLIP